MATEFPIDPEFNRFVEGIPMDAQAEGPEGEDGEEVDLELDESDLEELPDGSVVVKLDTGAASDGGSAR